MINLPVKAHARELSHCLLVGGLVLLLMFTALASTQASERVRPAIVEAGTLELHGTLYGERFWARLLPADERYGGHRVLQLLYSPPDPDDIGGTLLVDHPFLLLDRHARVIAWNERELGLSSVVFHGRAGYEIQHERSEMIGDQLAPVLIPVEADIDQPAWDYHLAPLMAMLSLRHRQEQPQAAWQMASVAFFTTPDQATVHQLRGNHESARLGPDLRVQIEWDEHGRIQRLRNSDDPEVIIAEVRAWIASGETSADE